LAGGGENDVYDQGGELHDVDGHRSARDGFETEVRAASRRKHGGPVRRLDLAACNNQAGRALID